MGQGDLVVCIAREDEDPPLTDRELTDRGVATSRVTERSPARGPLRTVKASIKGRSLATASSLTNSGSVIARRCRRGSAFSFAFGTGSNGLTAGRLVSTHQMQKETRALR